MNRTMTDVSFKNFVACNDTVIQNLVASAIDEGVQNIHIYFDKDCIRVESSASDILHIAKISGDDNISFDDVVRDVDVIDIKR